MTRTNVLLVDDEAPFVSALAKRLTKRGLHVTTAASGDEALDFLEQIDADVIVLDIRMPGLDGLETLAEIKRRVPEVEVIMLTGHGGSDDVVEGMSLGAFDFLVKPCDVELLRQLVEEAAAKKRAAVGTRG